MVDILVRNIDAATATRLKKKAKAAGKSVSDVAREALRAAVKPSKEEIWAEIDRVRECSAGRQATDLQAAALRDFHDAVAQAGTEVAQPGE